MNRVQIRQANSGDIPAVSRLQQQWREEGCIYGFVPASSEQLQDSLGRVF